jgi:hypothetical protein
MQLGARTTGGLKPRRVLRGRSFQPTNSAPLTVRGSYELVSRDPRCPYRVTGSNIITDALRRLLAEGTAFDSLSLALLSWAKLADSQSQLVPASVVVFEAAPAPTRDSEAGYVRYAHDFLNSGGSTMNVRGVGLLVKSNAAAVAAGLETLVAYDTLTVPRLLEPNGTLSVSYQLDFGA